MADIICRWRNGTPANVVYLVNKLPHKKISNDAFREIMGKDFFHTEYQLACQLGLYCESEDGFYYPRFDHDISENEAKEWLEHWFPRYYIPNPYTSKDGFNSIDCPTYVLKALYDFVKNNGACSYAEAFRHVFKENIRNNDDIVGNYINRYSKVLSFAKDGTLKITGSYEEVFGDMNRNNKKEFFDSFEKENNKEIAQTKLKNITPTQIIYYGVPGCGKSHQIQEDLKKKGITEENHQQKRVVFHPDYCNADFVGQILPVTKRDGGIRYQFKAGPFTKILREAYQNPTKEYALIIEEINRGNAAAIFGDLFQLLDRKKENDPIETVNGNSYGPGWSDYCIENDYINAYFRGAYDSEDIPNPLPPKKLGNITFNDNVDIRLPPNLSLYATMNTSDQNVFTLDNAFQRRWEMKQISNDLAHDDPAADTTKQYDQIVGSTSVKWGEFREKINEIIMQSAEENGLSSMEDKRLGGWFITPKKTENSEEIKITDEAFAEKVLKYLWDDAFKFDRSKHFGDIKTLEDLTKIFKKEGFKVFKDESISKLSPQNGTAAAQTGTPET